jgi:hypothetical protein
MKHLKASGDTSPREHGHSNVLLRLGDEGPILSVLAYLDWESLCAAGITCKELQGFATDDDVLWKPLAVHFWPCSAQLKLPSFRLFCLARLQQRPTFDAKPQTTLESLSLLIDITVKTDKAPILLCSKAVPMTQMSGGKMRILFEADWDKVVKPLLLGHNSGPFLASAIIRSDSKVLELPTNESPDCTDGNAGFFHYYSQCVDMSRPWWGETDIGPFFEAEWAIEVLTTPPICFDKEHAQSQEEHPVRMSTMAAVLQFNVYWEGGDVSPVGNQEALCALDVARWT